MRVYAAKTMKEILRSLRETDDISLTESLEIKASAPIKKT